MSNQEVALALGTGLIMVLAMAVGAWIGRGKDE